MPLLLRRSSPRSTARALTPGLSPVQSAESQSLVAAKLSRVLSSKKTNPQTTERVMLGMLAGWDVGRDVVDGSVHIARVHGADDIGQLVSAALTWPQGRMALLDRDKTLVAVGATFAPSGATTLLLGSWTPFSGHDVDADAKRVLEALTEARARFPAGTRALDVAQARGAAFVAAIESGEQAPPDALRAWMQETSQTARKSVRAWRLVPRSLDDIIFPDVLLNAPEVDVAIAVAMTRPKDSPWLRPAVLIVAHVPEGTHTAHLHHDVDMTTSVSEQTSPL
jgi:hypothetical protein